MVNMYSEVYWKVYVYYKMYYCYRVKGKILIVYEIKDINYYVDYS